MADIIIDVETRVNLRPLGDGLSAATAKASEFEKSINAANARVLAFGASAGLIYKLGEAFNGLVKSTIEVEKSLVDVNTLLNLNQKQIAEFGAELFNVAKGSSQSFEMVSEAAKELARQGLDSEKVLQRTADAMNLAKLSGISASSAVETLTAVLGTFNEQGLNSATIVDRLAAVDAKFAVSSEHLSDALKRSASSAVDANVSFNELIGVVTVVQERTARGGAVIGNAFKSIFTRLGRTEVLDDLANLGIAVKNTEGEILPTIQILKNLSASYAGLAPASRAFISEQVAGVYQIGTLKALMADLSDENSRFAKTQIVAANSSGSTSARINELNTSLDAYLSRLGSAGKQFGASFGREGLMSGMKDLVGGATGLLEMMTPDPKNSEEIGNKIGVGLMKGLGGFLTGPGLLAVGVIGGKILMKFVSDVAQAASSLASIGKSMSQGELQRQSLEQAIGREIQRQPALLDSVRLGTISIGAAQDQILAKLREEALLRQKILASAMQMAGPLGAAGVLTTDRGAMYTRPPTKAKGFIPNFNYGQEIEDAGASEHGYTAGKAYKTKIHDGRGKSFESFVNDNEDVRTVINSSGNLATFVTPPNGYGRGTTIAAKGFVPNFASPKSFVQGVAFEKALNKALTKKESTAGSDILDFPRAYLKDIDKKVKKNANLNIESEYGDAKLSFNSGNKRSLISKYIRANKKKNSIEGGEEFLDKHFSMFYKNGPDDNINTTSSSLASLLKQNPSLIDFFHKSTKTKDGERLLQSSASDRVSLTYLADRVLSSGFIPNFAPVTGGKFYDFDETLVRYPENTNPRELYFPESVSKASLTPLGRSLVGTKNPINVLTAREINSREAIHNFLTRSRIPVNKVVTSGSMFKRLGLDSSEKKAEFASRIYQKYGQPMSLVDDSFETVRGFENLNNPDITAKLYKTRGQKGLGQSFNAGGFVPNFAEFFKYPFTQKIRGRNRSVPPSEISGRYKEYEDQLFNGGLASLGFSDVNELNKLFNSNVEADFFARRNGNPYIIDAKAGYNDAQAGSYMNKIGPKGTFEKLKSNPKFLDFLTSKGVSVNNLIDAMVFGNMNDNQEKTLKKRGFLASGFVPNFGTVYRGVNPHGVGAGAGALYQALGLGGGAMSKGIMNRLIGAIGPNYTDDKPTAEAFGKKILSKKVNDKKLLRLGTYDEVAQLFAQNQHLMTPGLAGRIKNSTGEEQQAAIEQAGGELRAILKKRKFSGIKSPLHPADAKYLSEEKGLVPGNLVIPFAGGFVPNFAPNNKPFGRGARNRVFDREINGEKFALKVPNKTGSRRGEAITDAEEQQAMSAMYEKALAPYAPWKAVKQTHVRGGVVKQSLVTGETLGKTLRQAFPHGEGGPQGAMQSFKLFLREIAVKSRIPEVDGFGLSGNIMIPTQHKEQAMEAFRKNLNLRPLLDGSRVGLPNQSLQMIDYAKGFIPNFVKKRLINQEGGPSDDQRKRLTEMFATVTREEPIGASELAFAMLEGNRGTPWVDQALADFEKFKKHYTNDYTNNMVTTEGMDLNDPENVAFLRGQWGSRYFKKKIGKKGMFDRYHLLNPGTRPTAAGGFVPNFGMNLDDADQEFIRANIKGIRRADKIGALNFGSPFMMAKAGGPATYEQLAGFGDPRIADRLRGIVGKKGGRAAVLKSISAAGGFVPNFANYADSVMGLEENLSGNKATFHTSPFPHVRNSSQPTFSAAMADHGGLSNALKDSMKGQKEAGLMSKGYVPNFAIRDREVKYTGASGGVQKLEDAARLKLIAEINIEIDLFKKGHKTQLGLTESTKKLMDDQKVTATSQNRLNTSINKQVDAHNKASAAAGAAPSFFSMNNLRGLDKEGKKLEGAAATNRQLKLGAASMGMSMFGSQITQFTAGGGGALEKTGQAIEGISNAASYASMGAVFGIHGVVGGALLGLGVGLYKMFGNTEENVAKMAEKNKALSESIHNAGEAMISLKNNIALLGQASTEAEKKIIAQRMVQDRINLNAGINAAIEKLDRAEYGGVAINSAPKEMLIAARKSSNENGDLEVAVRGLAQAEAFIKARSEALTLINKPGTRKDLEIQQQIQTALLNNAPSESTFKKFEEYIAALGELETIDKRLKELKPATGGNPKDYQEFNQKRDEYTSKEKDLKSKKTELGKIVGNLLGPEFARSEILKLVAGAGGQLQTNKKNVAKTANSIQIDASLFEKNIATNKKNAMEAGIKSQKDSTLLNFENTQNLIEREFQLSLRNALGNIDAFSRAFEETANAIKKIEEDANAASIADEFKSFQQAQNGLNEEMKKAKDSIGQIDTGAVIYADFLQGIITNSGTTTDVLNNINELLDVEYSDDKTLSKSKKEHKVALENIRDNLIKEAAASEDAAKKSQNNIKIEKRKGQNTEELIQAQSKYAGILSEITLSYQNLDFAIKESIKTQDERAGYALEGQRLQRDFSSERMSAMGVTLSPAAAREDAYLESSRRQVEDAQNKIDASQRKAGGSQKSFQEGSNKFDASLTQDNITNRSNRNLEYLNFDPLNKDNVDETIRKIQEESTFYDKDPNLKPHLEAMLKSAQAYKADLEATQSLTNAKEGLEASIKPLKEAHDKNTRAFREEANKLEINKMKVENKLAFDSSGRKIESEKYLSRFMGPDMAQGENAATKISEDQSLAIQDYNATFDAKNADLDRQIALLEDKAISEYANNEITKGDETGKQITDLKAQQDQDGKKRELEIKKINDTASRDQGSLTETRKFDLEESQKALNRNLAKTKRQDASEIYLSQARINSENYLSRDIRSTMGEGGSAAAKIKEDTNLQIMQSRAEVALKGTDRQLQIDDLDVRRKALVGPGLDTERADLQDKIRKLTQENVADGQMQVANEEKINALMIQRLETLKESRTLSAITNSFFVDLANASDPIANLQRDVKNLAGSMQKGFEDAFVSFVDGTASAGDAFKGFVRSIAKEMAAMSARFTANLITNSLSQLGGTAFQSAQSYFGGSQGGVVRAATGGHITGGSGVRDDIPAILTGGEYVIKKGSVNKYGVDFLEKINAQKFASGGQALSNQYTLGTFSGNYAKGDSETLRGAPTPLLGGVDLNGGSFTMGQYNIDPRLSNIALSDENNPQNRIREDMAELDMERKIAFDDYSSDKRRALVNFQIEKDNKAQAALINAAIQIAMAGISAKIGQMSKSAEAARAAKDIGNASAAPLTVEGVDARGERSVDLQQGSKAEVASIARGNALIGKGVTSVDPGKFNFFSKSIEPKYNIGNTSLNSNQFNEFSKIQALQQQLGKFQEDAMQTKEANTLKGLDGGSGDASRDTVNERIAKKVIQHTKDLEALKKPKMQKRASGGFISDGSGTKDDVPALLMGGEYVISKPAVQKYGVDFMSRVNSGSLTGFARGGSVGDLAPLGSGGSSSTGGNEGLIESINNLSAKIQSQLDKTGGGAGGGAISNNIEININVSESGEVKGSNMSSGDKAKESGTASSEEQKQEDNKKRQELAGMLQGMITSTLVKEQRKGGLLAR